MPSFILLFLVPRECGISDPAIYSKESGDFPFSLERTEALERPRIIKTHLDFDLLPEQLMKNKAKACSYIFITLT